MEAWGVVVQRRKQIGALFMRLQASEHNRLNALNEDRWLAHITNGVSAHIACKLHPASTPCNWNAKDAKGRSGMLLATCGSGLWKGPCTLTNFRFLAQLARLLASRWAVHSFNLWSLRQRV